ncbi:MAG: pepsin/retropepsin-like aspartic protease family protein [Planctomycetota bacterium]
MIRPTLPFHHRLLLVLLVAPLLSWHLGSDVDPDIEAAIARIDQALYDGELEPAASAIDALIARHATDPRLWSAVGHLHGRYNRLAEAEAAFRRAARELEVLGRASEAAEARRELGHVLYRRKNFPAAVAALERSRRAGGAVNGPLMNLLAAFDADQPYRIRGEASVKVPLSTEIVPTVQVSIGDAGPFRFVVDTGAGLSVISSHVAEACGIESHSEAKAYGAGGSNLIPIDLARVDALFIGELSIDDVPVAVVDSARLEFRLRQLEEPLRLDGILGLPLLREFARVTLDFQGKTFELAQGGEETGRDAGHPINFVKDQLFVVVETASEEALHFFIDTGANVSSITDQGLQRIAIDDSELTFSEKSVFGAAGHKLVDKEYRPAELSMGDRVFHHPALIVETTDPHQRRRVRRDGVLGSDLLETGRITFDFAAMQMRWNEAAASPR